MLDQLISFTNSNEYLNNWNMWTTEVCFHRYEQVEMKMVLELFDDFSENREIKQVWEVTCEGYWTSSGLEEYKRPFNRLALYNNHPALLNESSQQFFSIIGSCDNIPGLMGDLYIAHIKACGNWVDFHWLFDSLPKTLVTQRQNQLSAPKPLLNTYLEIFDRYGVKYKLNELDEQEENYLVLLFSNPDFCPDNYNFRQPYVIGKKFNARLISK